VGVRFANEDAEKPAGVDLLAWYFERELADAAPIRGTFYEGDLDMLQGVGIPLPLEGRDKTEYGVNLTARRGGLRIYGQYVAQEIAGLERRRFEAEPRSASAERALASGVTSLNWLQPAVRYSTIDNRFERAARVRRASVAWDWAKLDLGLRVGILRNLELTVEYARHDMKTRTGTLHPDEALVTVWVSF
jgi:hypothetical protein